MREMPKKYPEGTSSKHGTVRIPKDLVVAIEEFLKTDLAKKMGFLHITDIATEAVRNFLKEQGYYPVKPQLKHFNLDDSGVLIQDPELKDQMPHVSFKPDKIFCDYCESDNCRHVEFARGLPQVQKLLRKKGWKPE